MARGFWGPCQRIRARFARLPRQPHEDLEAVAVSSSWSRVSPGTPRADFVTVWRRVVAVALRVRDDAGVGGPGRVGWVWIDAASLSVVLGAAGFWIGGGLGAGVGVAAGGLAPLLIERATRKQEAAESAREAEGLSRRYGPAYLLEPGLGVVPFTGRAAELEVLQAWCRDGRAGLVRLVTGGGGAGRHALRWNCAGGWRRSAGGAFGWRRAPSVMWSGWAAGGCTGGAAAAGGRLR